MMRKLMRTVHTMSESDQRRKGRLGVHCVCVYMSAHTHLNRVVVRPGFTEKVKFEVMP